MPRLTAVLPVAVALIAMPKVALACGMGGPAFIIPILAIMTAGALLAGALYAQFGIVGWNFYEGLLGTEIPRPRWWFVKLWVVSVAALFFSAAGLVVAEGVLSLGIGDPLALGIILTSPFVLQAAYTARRWHCTRPRVDADGEL